VKMKIGILGASDIAFRRFLPALKKCSGLEYAGVASRTPEKAARFVGAFGGQAYPSYNALIEDETIDAVYVPLPPALHFEWGRKVLLAGKHLLMEKPFTVSTEEADQLLRLAQEKNLAVHENYMFLYHSQLSKVKELISDGTLGELRLIQICFGFPKRPEGDFRYCRALGGGALLDCGGYPVRLGTELLGETCRVVHSRLCQPEGCEVDLYGSALMENETGLCAQIGFGMDNAYQCRLEVWGSRATLIAPRIFTAGTDVQPEFILRTSSDEQRLCLETDDQFLHSIERFGQAIQSEQVRAEEQSKILAQCRKVTEVKQATERGMFK